MVPVAPHSKARHSRSSLPPQQTENCCSSEPCSWAEQTCLPRGQKHSSQWRANGWGQQQHLLSALILIPSRVSQSLDSPGGVRLNQKIALCLQHHSKATSFQKGCLICWAKLEPNHWTLCSCPSPFFPVLHQKTKYLQWLLDTIRNQVSAIKLHLNKY